MGGYLYGAIRSRDKHVFDNRLPPFWTSWFASAAAGGWVEKDLALFI